MTKRFLLLASFIILLLPQLLFSQQSVGNNPPGFKFAPAANLPVVSLPAINRDSMLAEDAIDEHFKGRPYRFGYNHLVYYTPENSGTWTELSNGDRIWQLDVKARNSFSLNFGFSNFKLPAGAKLFVYSKDGKQIQGAYTEKNNTPDKFFGSELIQGDEAVLEYYEPKAVKGQSSFILFRITQGYKDLVNYLKSDGFGQAGACLRNINCPEFYDYSTQKRSVVCIIIGGNGFCSGALVNNTANDGTPYILTANHCGTADGTWTFRFNWEAPGCQNPSSDPPFQYLNGATPVARSGVSDFNLIKIDSTPPLSFHAFYAGWNHALAAATSVTAIHHPAGDIKKGSRADNAVTDTFYDAGNGTALVWQIGQWTDGATEGGSSGSPLFDQNKRIVGQLYGGPSDCGVSADQLRDYYGRFCVSWDSGATPQTRLKDWLDPGNTGGLTNDGYDPAPPADSVDVAIYNVLSPLNNSCDSRVVPSISVTNLGSKTDTVILVKYHIDNVVDSVYTWRGSLASQANTTIQLPALAVAPGAHTFYVNVNLPGGDQNLYNDSSTSSFITFAGTGVVAPLKEGFEEATLPATGWEVTTPPSTTTWAKSNFGAFGTSAHSAVIDEFSPAVSTAGETPTLFSPAVDMTHAPTPSFLKFDVAYALYTALQTDSLAILVSADCGTTWTKIYQRGGSDLATAPLTNTLFAPTANQWRRDSVNITNLVGSAGVLFQFEVISGYGNAIYVDNIDIADTGNSVGISPANDNIFIQVYPNPFTENFNLQFSLDAAANMDAAVYSIDGKKMVPLFNHERIEPGFHQLEINTNQLANGIYILKVNERYFKLEKLK